MIFEEEITYSKREGEAIVSLDEVLLPTTYNDVLFACYFVKCSCRCLLVMFKVLIEQLFFIIDVGGKEKAYAKTHHKQRDIPRTSLSYARTNPMTSKYHSEFSILYVAEMK